MHGIVELKTTTGGTMLTEYTNYMLAAGLTTGTVRLRLLHLDHLRRAHPTLTAVTGSQLHASLATTQIYVEIAQEQQEAAILALPVLHVPERSGRIAA